MNTEGVGTPETKWSQAIKSIAEGYCHTSVRTKLRRLMEHYDQLTLAPGQYLKIDTEHDYPLFDGASREELEYLIGILDEQQLFEYDAGQQGYRITASGWTFLEPQGGGAPGSCFVAMAFGAEFDLAYDQASEPALKDCGFDSIRVDRVEHTENINDKIIADIRRSQFMVADFSGHRNGVYFEAGYELGLLARWLCGPVARATSASIASTSTQTV